MDSELLDRRMIAVKRLWRWRKDDEKNYVETVEPGERCDWVTKTGVYEVLGHAVEAPDGQ